MGRIIAVTFCHGNNQLVYAAIFLSFSDLLRPPLAYGEKCDVIPVSLIGVGIWVIGIIGC